MKKKKLDAGLVLQLQAIREQIDDILDGGGGPITEKPAKAAGKKRSTTRGTRDPGGARKLAIVVGHTAAAPGASGRAPISQSEYPWNKDLADKIVAECAGLGASAEAFFRDDGGISGAYSRAAASGAKAVVELHFNADGGAALGQNKKNGLAKALAQAFVAHFP
jgi:hypothetical protein